MFKNLTKCTMRVALFALIVGLAVGRAEAATITLSLTGTVSQGSYSSFDVGGNHYDFWTLALSGLPSSLSVAQGDTINATVTLDQAFTIPASVSYTFFAFGLQGPSFPSGAVDTTGSTTFSLAGNSGLSGSFGTSTSGQIVNSAVFYPSLNGPITFDSVESDFDITGLGGLADLDYAFIQYGLVSPSAVPEPATFATLLAGLGSLGLAAIRRKK